jgi:hypothetical protein
MESCRISDNEYAALHQEYDAGWGEDDHGENDPSEEVVRATENALARSFARRFTRRPISSLRPRVTSSRMVVRQTARAPRRARTSRPAARLSQAAPEPPPPTASWCRLGIARVVAADSTEGVGSVKRAFDHAGLRRNAFTMLADADVGNGARVASGDVRTVANVCRSRSDRRSAAVGTWPREGFPVVLIGRASRTAITRPTLVKSSSAADMRMPKRGESTDASRTAHAAFRCLRRRCTEKVQGNAMTRHSASRRAPLTRRATKKEGN